MAAACPADQTVLIVTASAQTRQQLFAALQFFAAHRALKIVEFPDYETLPYDYFSPGEELVSERLRTLSGLVRGHPCICLVSVPTLMQRLAPPQFVVSNSLSLQVGERFSMETQRQQLVNAGYRHTETVTKHGEFAVRGSLLDLFSMGQELPLRIDLFDDEIDSIRRFDPDTQLTVEKIEALEVLPGREFGLTREDITRFQDNWYQNFDGDPRDCPAFNAVSKGHAPQGIEAYLPLFHASLVSLLDYLPDDCLLFFDPGAAPAAETFWHEINQRHEQLFGDLERPLLAPAQSYIPAGEIFRECRDHPRVEWGKTGEMLSQALPDIAFKHRASVPSEDFRAFLDRTDQVLLTTATIGRRELVAELLQREHLNADRFDSWKAFAESSSKLGICVAPLEQGFVCPDGSMALITESELLREKVLQPGNRSMRQPGWSDPNQIIRNLTELRVGAPVVHIEHGVGRYRGLETLKIDGRVNEFLHLEYAGENKLYVPVSSLNLISRYTGADAAHAPLGTLGSDQWDKAKRKAREQVRDTAVELLEIYARRMARRGYAFTCDESEYRRFCEEFPFEETQDQLDTMAAVEQDMAAERAMDRLVCGDVGFGKTEVAMRAAYIAASCGKQVLMLVPTTLLARQHFESFQNRFVNWPWCIDTVSRLRSTKDQARIMAEFSSGAIDILIGTHKLITDKIRTDRLGLLVVDEEHRFGVHQKEKLKSLKAEIDILTLTATPIPRTLNMAMASVRDLSIIATPPARRLAVKTFVRSYEKGIVREAIQRELQRGGQVYVIHNEVRSIERTAEELRELMPDCRIGVAHGQMHERNLELVVSDFYHHLFDVLVCSTIIETGIDIPNANTIIIERADKFGLAQLHQLRGRVGRSHHQAYAYLLTADTRNLTADAVRRLEAIASADHLGCGFTLATHDLEIRGAGELLGDSQSGQIHSIGFELYQQMLEQAVKSLQSGGVWSDADLGERAVEVNLNASALIPENYLPDVNGRLQLYKRIAATETEKQLQDLQVEMIDRFGLLPDQLKLLIRQQSIKLRAIELGIRKIDCGEEGGKLHFNNNLNIEPNRLIELVQNEPNIYRFEGQTGLRFNVGTDNPEQRFQLVESLLSDLE